MTKYRKSRAFTLVEIMLSVVIFTIGIIAIMSLFPLSLRDVARARVMTQAAFLCQAKTEEYLGKPGDTVPDYVNSNGTFEPEFPDFTYVVRKYPYSGTQGSTTYDSQALWEIHVSVFHTINNRQSPLVEHFALKGCIGEQKGF
ncbi:MAG: type II secretion system GspH family protein [Firmicutes bacterium]|nr:type II secretion system GspH family protein [Bacillota bacterium]